MNEDTINKNNNYFLNLGNCVSSLRTFDADDNIIKNCKCSNIKCSYFTTEIIEIIIDVLIVIINLVIIIKVMILLE